MPAASACFQRIIGDEKDLIALRDQLDEVVGEWGGTEDEQL
jgi:hypothetical protein